MPDLTTIFLDTNIFLHYKSLEQVDWLKITGARDVLLVIAPIVLRELDHHKDMHEKKHMRERVQGVIRRLGEALDGCPTGEDARVRDHVRLRLDPQEPLIDFASHMLSPASQDDQLVASVICWIAAHPNHAVQIMTADIGLRVKARGKHIPVIAPPDDMKLPEQVDPAEREMAELRKELHVLKNSAPKLRIGLAEMGEGDAFSVAPPKKIDADAVEAEMDEIRRRYPMLTQGRPTGYVVPPFHDAILFSPLHNLILTPLQIHTYNSELTAFYQRCDPYVRNKIARDNLALLTLPLHFELFNGGSAPAQDVDVFLTLPAWLNVTGKHPLSDPPKMPRPPAHPEPPGQSLSRMLSQNTELSDRMLRVATGPSSSDRLLAAIAHPKAPLEKSLRVKQEGAQWKVDAHFRQLKHSLTECAGPVYISFTSHEEVKSFDIHYRINAANMPQEVIGKLPIVIKVQEG